MPISKLSIIVPVYNEKQTVLPVLQQLLQLQLPGNISKEIVVVDDASTDGSGDLIADFFKSKIYPETRFLRHGVNKGKGGSIVTALSQISGDYFIIQDADLELDPNDIAGMTRLVSDDQADVVYGSRFINAVKGADTTSYLANRFLTWFSNVSFGTALTDMETCYKLIPVGEMQRIQLAEMRFGFEPEITAKLARNKQLRWMEYPITYKPRKALEGKKIGWKDGVRALVCIINYGILKK